MVNRRVKGRHQLTLLLGYLQILESCEVLEIQKDALFVIKDQFGSFEDERLLMVLLSHFVDRHSDE